MRLSISNIAWESVNDRSVYEMMSKLGYIGLEIAPTRVFPDSPYDKLEQAVKWKSGLEAKYGFDIPSMQSIWYGRNEKIFGSDGERKALLDYTKKAIDFASVLKCGNLVFGCPRNRNVPDGVDADIAVSFFKELGDYAADKGTIIGMEANPPIYNTNFINNTESALKLISKVESDGFKLNLDVGTIIENNENLELLSGNVNLISHVHISEPGLKIVEQRRLHSELRNLLETEGYKGFISIEMGKTERLDIIEETMRYVKDVFE